MIENPAPVLNVIFVLSGSILGRFGLHFGGILASFLMICSTPGARFGKRALRHEKSKKKQKYQSFLDVCCLLCLPYFLCIADGAGASAHLENR